MQSPVVRYVSLTMTSPALNGLIKKRSEIAGRIQALHDEAGRLIASLDHLDAAIRMFDPEIDFQDIPVKLLPPPNAAFRGEFQRSLLEMLRGVQRWQTTDELAVKVMVQRRMNETDRALRVVTRKRVGHALTRLRGKGVVASRKHGKGALLAWKLTRGDVQLEGGWRNGSG